MIGCRSCMLIPLIAACAAAAMDPVPLNAAVQFAATTEASGNDSSDQTPPAPTGFSVQKEDAKIVNALDDFDRYRGKKAWEIAFRTLGSLSEQDCKGMVPAGEAGRE